AFLVVQAARLLWCRRRAACTTAWTWLLPGVQKLLDAANVDVFGEFDAVDAGESRLGRGRADAVAAQIVVQVVGATGWDANEVSFAFGLHAQHVLLSLGHGSSLFY